MDNFQLNFDEVTAKILLHLIQKEGISSAEYRELVPLELALEEQLGEG